MRGCEKDGGMNHRWMCILSLVALLSAAQVVAQDQPEKPPEKPPAEQPLKKTAEPPPPGLGQLSGNPIEFAAIGDGSIVIKGTEEDRRILQALIEQLDKEVDRPSIEFMHLESATAKDVATQLQKVFQQIWYSYTF